MKKFLFIFFLLFAFVNVKGQDTTITMSKFYYHDTLTATYDTLDIQLPDTKGINFLTISCKSDSTDSVYVYTYSRDEAFITPRSLVDLSTDTTVTFIVLAKSELEFYLVDPIPYKIRLISASGITYFTLNAWKEGL